MSWIQEDRGRYHERFRNPENPLQHRLTLYIGPRFVKHRVTKDFVDFHYTTEPAFASEKDCRVFAQNAHVAVEIYDYYVKLFNPDYETVSVHDERFDIQYLFKTKPKEDWRSVDYYNPRIQVIPLEDGVEIKKTFDTDYGKSSLEISYILRTGAFLKHKIVFTNKLAESKTFRVVMKLAGITNDKVKHSGGKEQVIVEKHIPNSPFIFIGEDNKHLKLVEYFWSLGLIDELTGEWSPTTLKDIVLDIHAQGMKADIMIGNYTLALGENLEVDPTTSTWQVGASLDDTHVKNDTTNYETMGQCNVGESSGNYYDSGFRFTSVNIAQGSTIESAYLKGYCGGRDGDDCQTDLYGEDVDDADNFDDANTLVPARDRTTATVAWDNPHPKNLTWATSPDIKTIIQEIVDRSGWSSGNALVILQITDHASTNYQIVKSYDGSSTNCAKLEVTYTSGAETKTKTYNADILLKKPDITKTYTADVILGVPSYTKEYTADVLLKKPDITKTYSADVLLSKAFTKTYSADTLLQKTVPKTYAADVLLQKQGLTKTYSTDVLLKKSDLTKTYSADVLLLKSIPKTYPADVLLKKPDITKTYTADVIIGAVVEWKGLFGELEIIQPEAEMSIVSPSGKLEVKTPIGEMEIIKR